MTRNAEKSADFDEIWLEDAATIAERDRIAASGFRMPAAAKPATNPPATRPTNATAGRIVTTKGRTGISPGIVATIATALLIVAAGFVWSRRPVVTLAEFERLEIGMTQNECTTVIGSGGVTVMQSDAPHHIRQPGVPFLDSTELIQWTNNDGTNAVATFSGGKLINKAQIGLE